MSRAHLSLEDTTALCRTEGSSCEHDLTKDRVRGGLSFVLLRDSTHRGICVGFVCNKSLTAHEQVQESLQSLTQLK